MEIKTVKIQGQGYLLNGIMNVPKADGNREYELIKEWLKTNEPEPEFTEEEIQKQELAKWKAERAEKVANIAVVYNNVIYQGDEVSQGRMNRVITALPDDITTVNWVAKDNSIQNLTKVDLVEILRLSSIELASVWTEGRPE